MYFIDSRLHGFPIGFGSRTYTSTSAAVKLECSKNDHVSPRIWKNLQESGRNSKWEHALWDPSNLDASKNPFACDRAATHCSLRHALHQIVYWEYTKREPTSIQAFFERGEQARDQDELQDPEQLLSWAAWPRALLEQLSSRRSTLCVSWTESSIHPTWRALAWTWHLSCPNTQNAENKNKIVQNFGKLVQNFEVRKMEEDIIQESQCWSSCKNPSACRSSTFPRTRTVAPGMVAWWRKYQIMITMLGMPFGWWRERRGPGVTPVKTGSWAISKSTINAAASNCGAAF